MAKTQIGVITHYFPNVGVGVLKLDKALKVGDKIEIERGEESFTQGVTSMQVEHESIDVAKPGDEVGLKLDQEVKKGAKVYLA